MDFDVIPSLVSAKDNMNEVRQAIFSIDFDNAPGLDGFCSIFYQSC